MATPKAKFADLALVVALCAGLLLGLTAPAWAGLDEGVAAYERGDYATALRELRPLAKQSHAKAQFFLGFMYKYGLGVPQDVAEAVKWFRKAAEQGDADAQYNLAQMHIIGAGIPQHYGEAMRWYRKAAEQGNANAQNNLGGMYRHGYGVAEDFVLAHMWYNLAAAQGNFGSSGQRDIVAMKMTPAQISEAQKLAREWRPKK